MAKLSTENIALTSNPVHITLIIIFILISPCFGLSQESGNGKYNRIVKQYPYSFNDLTVIGNPKSYSVKEEDTFLDIAREFELGFNEMTALYPQADPWMPTSGKTLAIPAFWILPPTKLEQLVINIPEMRLYFFEKKASVVQTYPVGIGSDGWETPEGSFSITEKRKNPNWYVPKSLQKEYGLSIMPPGPENPLGRYIMKFSNTSYALHGTHWPWGVGRLISHGCLRCYPEHMRLIYPQVGLGTNVEIIYEPIKFGLRDGRIYVEIHPDIYGKISDFNQYAADRLKSFPMSAQVDQARYELAALSQNGMPMDITLSSEKSGQAMQENRAAPVDVKPIFNSSDEIREKNANNQ